MEARNRPLPNWFQRIKNRQLTLPRFQRSVAWGHGEVSGLLTTVLRGLPSGAALILEVGDKEQFESRTMVDAPTSGDKATEQLLDGQQRLTALWRSLNDTYTDRTYLVRLQDEDISDGSVQPVVHGEARWMKNGKRYPLWIDSPQECWSREMIPLRLLRPDDILIEIRQWLAQAEQESHEKKDALFDSIIALRDRVKAFNLPYLALPADTQRDVALDVFIKMNTSSVKLTIFDIIVALVEDETGLSLHDYVATLDNSVPRAKEYADLPGLILDIVALRQGRPPSQAGYKGIDYPMMLEDWEIVEKSIRGMVSFLEDESVFDAQRLPSYTPLPVIAALWEFLPAQPDALGNARLLLKKYLWRAFLTSRYEQSSTSNALQDFRALHKALLQNETEDSIPIFNQNFYPVPTKELILQAAWPTYKNIFARGLLSLQVKYGAEDLADGKKATVATITSKLQPREYHHLFPASLLRDAGVYEGKISCALNCALLTWKTNRAISNKTPLAYLKERADNCSLGEEELVRRLGTHLIPYAALNVGYDGLSAEEQNLRIPTDFDNFLSARSDMLEKACKKVFEGKL
jgi:Uncharacterized conserved protein